MDVVRMAPGSDATTATRDQICRLVGLLPDDGEVPLFVFDAGYDPVALSHELGLSLIHIYHPQTTYYRAVVHAFR